MNYQPISEQEFKALLTEGKDINGYEIDAFLILRIDFDQIPLAYGDQLRFAHCLFKKDLTILNLKSTKEFFTLKFDSCIFEGPSGLTIALAEFSNIKIENCVSTNINISQSKLIGVDVDTTVCTNTLSIHDTECGYFELDHTSKGAFKLVFLDSSKLELTRIRGIQEIGRVFVKNAQEVWLRGKIGEVELTEKFNRVEILNIWDEDQKRHLNAQIGKLKFPFRTFDGDVFVRDAHIETLDFSELNAPTARVQFIEVSIGNAKIVDCSIPNMVWNQLEFKNPPQLTGTDFSGLKMSNVKWPKYSLSKTNQEKKSKTSDLKYNIETYRQLKAASIANHNQIEALAFYRNEMKLYWKLIRIEGGIPWYDRLLVFVNRWSSDFGQNWFLPLLWMFLFALIFYSSILNWNYFGNNWPGGDEFGQFWVMFNPVHKTPEYINTGAGLFTEFIMRVVSGYFIYHFIKASRKFGKV